MNTQINNFDFYLYCFNKGYNLFMFVVIVMMKQVIVMRMYFNNNDCYKFRHKIFGFINEYVNHRVF